MDHLRILSVIPYYAPAWAYGGPVRVAYEINKRLAARGHQVTVATTDALDRQKRLENRHEYLDGVEVIRFRNLHNGLAWQRLFLPIGFQSWLSEHIDQFDLVHLNDIRTLQNLLALPILQRSRLPFIVMPHGGLPRELGRGSLKWIYDQIVGWQLLEQASILHALTPLERAQYHALGIDDARIVEIPNGIPVAEFDLEVDTEAFKVQHGMPPHRPIVGFLARLNAIKGPDFLIDAFAEVRRQRPDAILLMAGPDDGALADLQAQIARLGLTEAVHLIGYVGDSQTKACVYRASHVYVLPSRYEIQGISLLEALLNGTPVITTHQCGLSPLLADKGMADVVPFGDVQALAHAMLRQLDVGRDDYRQQARRNFVTEQFNWDRMVDQWEVVYQRTLRDKESS
ncbi:MAG: glycosyltransferase [Chloroflexi bacterium]|nr:glycosyltransferase [Chloroflexota bacterium]